MGRIKHSLNENTVSILSVLCCCGKGDIVFDNYSIVFLFFPCPYTSHAFVFCAVSYASKKIMKTVNKLTISSQCRKKEKENK